MKLYTKDQKSTFPYWFAHWWAYNKTAWNLGCWKFKYLFHDFEKPWLKLFLDYPEVQKRHRKNNSHHLLHFFLTRDDGDWEAMIIDWECSRFSKKDAPLNAYETWKKEIKGLETRDPNNKTVRILNEMGVIISDPVWNSLVSIAKIELKHVLIDLNLYDYKDN